jgi:hypothetical protein
MFVADGAGSAARGADGAERAVHTANLFIKRRAEEGFALLEDWESVAFDCVNEVRARIFRQADDLGLRHKDFATTFLGAVCYMNVALFMQIGDGAIVFEVDNGLGLQLAIPPMHGEYANSTHFVTDDNALGILRTRVFEHRKPLHVAMFTDGLERLALDFRNAPPLPHQPFFRRLFDMLLAKQHGRERELYTDLLDFLDCDNVNSRTDDDKTLALACRMA